jgi:hypothetical protein
MDDPVTSSASRWAEAGSMRLDGGPCVCPSGSSRPEEPHSGAAVAPRGPGRDLAGAHG